jgi:hypothetical protein
MILTRLAFSAVIFSIVPAHAQERKEPETQPYLLPAGGAMAGTWLNTDEATRSIPKVEIFREGPAFKIRFWGRTHPHDTPFGPPDTLVVLSDHSDPANRPAKPPAATAFVTQKADFALHHFTLRLSGGLLRVEGVTLFTDGSGRPNRIKVETFRKLQQSDTAEAGNAPAKGREKMLGTWHNLNPETQSIPKIDIVEENGILKIRFWGRTHPEDSPFGPPDPLHLLSTHSDIPAAKVKQTEAVAFATHRADFAIRHFSLKFVGENLHLEGVTLFTDNSKRLDRLYSAVFARR